MIKAVAIDIDGTITDERRRLNLKAVAILRELERRGVMVVLATGNILCVAESARTFIGVSGGIIAENGGIIKDPEMGIERYLGDVVEVRRAFNHLAARYCVTPVPMSELRKTEVAVLRRGITAGEVRDCLRNFKVEVVDTKFAIHIKSPEVSKGRALEELMELKGVDMHEVAAVGDSENDRDMLARSGYGIAVGDDSLKDVADIVTPSRYGEGAVEALQHLLARLR
ncbi:phosphoglycolate phosphatase [Candidatus Pyrohabitans sp.]